MSFNFTGTTNRRNVNLGNRNLLGKNKSVFLKSAQIERQKREQLRIKTNSAIVIQSACRRYLDLLSWRKHLSQHWDGASIVQFKYFFPYLARSQAPEQSISQLHLIEQNLPRYSYEEIRQLEDTLIDTFTLLVADGGPQHIDLEKEILLLLDKIFTFDNSVAFGRSHNENFTASLVTLYLDGQIFALAYILKFSKRLSLKALVTLFIDPKINIIEDAICHNWLQEFHTFENNLMTYLCNDRNYLKSLTDTEKLLLLSNISISLYKYPELEFSRTLMSTAFLSLIQLLLGTLSQRITISNNTELKHDLVSTDNFTVGNTRSPHNDTENSGIDIVSVGSGIQISSIFFDSIKPLFQLENFQVLQDTTSDIFIGYISALLHFASIIEGDQSNSLKLSIDIHWILKENNSALVYTCFSRISSLSFYEHMLQGKRFTEFLPSLILTDEHRSWWDSLIVFQEFLSNIISLTSDEKFYQAIIISKEDLINFIKFLKTFVTEILLKYREFAKPIDYNPLFFMQQFKKSLSLLHVLYMKDLKLKILNKNFWILSDYDLEMSSISATIPIIDKIHNDTLFYNQNDEDGESIDFLQNSKLIQLFKNNIPKKIVDFFYILAYAPFMVPFEKRAEIFHFFIEYDKRNNNVNEWFPTKVEGVISRDNMLFDSFNSFGNLTGTEFKRQFSVQFINNFGEREAGIDGGGLTKELLTTLVSSTFVPSEENRVKNKGLQFFKEAVDYKLYCNPEFFFKLQYERLHPKEKIPYACTNDEYLKICRFLGMVIGKCLYDNVLLDISFTSFFLNTCATLGSKFFKNLIGEKISVVGHNNSFDELKNLDLSLCRSLNYILVQTDPEKFENMSLMFTVDDVFYDENRTLHHVEVPLLPLQKRSPNSAPEPVPVAVNNKMQFVRLVTSFKLSKQTDLVMKYFVEGLFQVIKPYWLLLFNPYELQTLISGDDDAIDIDDLQRNVEYGGFLETDQTISDLFDILREFSRTDRGKFIKFVTSSPKQPLLGFKELNPKFGIRNSGSDTSRLPTASTCVNLLKIPDYKNKELLREKLLYSINSKAGFDLS